MAAKKNRAVRIGKKNKKSRAPRKKRAAKRGAAPAKKAPKVAREPGVSPRPKGRA